MPDTHRHRLIGVPVQADVAPEIDAKAHAAEALRMGELRGILLLGVVFLVTMPLAAWFARPFQTEATPAVTQDPSGGRAVWFVVAAVVFVALAVAMAMLVLWAVRTGRRKVLQAMVLAAVALALVIVLARPIMALTLILPIDLAWAVGFVAAGVLTWALWRHPSWYVLDSVAVLVAAAVAGIVGAVLGVTFLLVLLVAVAGYDLVAVKRTGHMQKLARAVVELRLPVAFTVPTAAAPRRRVAGPSPAARPGMAESQASATPRIGQRAAVPRRGRPTNGILMGIGDLIFPISLVVAALDPRRHWNDDAWFLDAGLPGLAAGLGMLAGFALLARTALSGRPQPGLPLLNGGAILGFFAGLFFATGSLRFW